MGACLSRGYDPALEKKKNGFQSSSLVCSHDSSPKKLSFVYKNRTVSTVVSKSKTLSELNSFLLSTFELEESTYVVTGVLVTVTGPLMPFFMLPYLHSNEPETPYPLVIALVKDFAINNWGCAPDAQAQAAATVEWVEIERLGSELYSSPSSALLASRLFETLKNYGYVRLHLPPESPILTIFQAATTSIHRYCAFPEGEKQRKFLGFNQHKFVGYSHAKGSARQFLQLRTTRARVTDTGKEVPVFDTELTEAYLALQGIAYQLFKLLCHPDLTPQTHLSPEFVSSLLDAPCPSVDAFNHCSSVPRYQFIGTNVFRVYQYLREEEAKKEESPGFLKAATSVHSDMGLLTVSPHSNLPGLTVLQHSDASRWVNLEMQPGSTCVDGSDVEKNFIFVFVGETMAQLTKGALLAPLHFVDERTPTKPRFSMPFFLRARQKSVLPAVEGLCGEMTVESFMRDLLHQRKQVWGHKPTTDF